jgi:hypothetical protein
LLSVHDFNWRGDGQIPSVITTSSQNEPLQTFP